MIEIPSFDPRFALLSICSHVKTVDRGVLSLIKKLPPQGAPLVAKTSSKAGAPRISLFGGGTDETHVHVNLFRTVFEGHQLFKSPPKVNSKIGVIQNRLAPFMGHKATTLVNGYFFVATNHLTPDRGVIGPALTPETIGGVTLRQSAGTLKIDGGPIRSIEWLLRHDKEEVRIELEVFNRDRITERSTVESYDLLISAFRLMVLGERSDEASTKNEGQPRGLPPVVRG